MKFCLCTPWALRSRAALLKFDKTLSLAVRERTLQAHRSQPCADSSIKTSILLCVWGAGSPQRLCQASGVWKEGLDPSVPLGSTKSTGLPDHQARAQMGQEGLCSPASWTACHGSSGHAHTGLWGLMREHLRHRGGVGAS